MITPRAITAATTPNGRQTASPPDSGDLAGVGLGFDLRFVAHEDGRLAAVGAVGDQVAHDLGQLIHDATISLPQRQLEFADRFLNTAWLPEPLPE